MGTISHNHTIDIYHLMWWLWRFECAYVRVSNCTFFNFSMADQTPTIPPTHIFVKLLVLCAHTISGGVWFALLSEKEAKNFSPKRNYFCGWL